jgi:hypothetical protein
MATAACPFWGLRCRSGPGLPCAPALRACSPGPAARIEPRAVAGPGGPAQP